ncbi:histidinol phosphate phosphatase [uncultured Clostridium sp.]|uniref:histidinol phosphate phosphatase n=1 Tax=uncultured Clostridium sp. TaxID=59620 RepID=UPI0025890B95|nr:histidinol phosphate phosphatase [uncultured Clostridium sp.]MDU1348623.1 histidinol phosphate phosphatase [Clostridium argentinense]
MFDTHIHTDFSSDSNMHIKDVISSAKKLNLGIIITDHIDLNYPDKTKFNVDLKDYFKSYNPYRSNNILIGIELGMDMDYKAENEQISYNPFDHIIGSQHTVNGIDIYDQSLYKGKSKNEIFSLYFENMISSIKTHSYINTLAHIDFISRYCPYEDKELYYSEHGDYIDEVIKLCLSNGISLEINTRRLNDPTSIENLIDIYKRYHELGGKYITIGSDAHIPSSIGVYFKQALEICDYVGLSPIYYKDKKAEYMKRCDY